MPILQAQSCSVSTTLSRDRYINSSLIRRVKVCENQAEPPKIILRMINWHLETLGQEHSTSQKVLEKLPALIPTRTDRYYCEEHQKGTCCLCRGVPNSNRPIFLPGMAFRYLGINSIGNPRALTDARNSGRVVPKSRLRKHAEVPSMASLTLERLECLNDHKMHDRYTSNGK